ncbi:MAG: phage protease [Nitrosomonadaceae bacterium]
MLADHGKNVSTIEILKIGKVHDRDLNITMSMFKAFVKNFDEKIVGSGIPVNLSHNRGGEAGGWIIGLSIHEDRLLADVEWTPLGMEKIKSKQFKFTSSELARSFPHHETGEPVKNVLIGVALTNIPAVKGLNPVALSEQVQTYISNHNHMKKFKELLASLMAKKTISLSEFQKFEDVADEAVDAGEVTPEEAEAAKKDVKDVAEEPKEPEAEPEKEPAKEPEKEPEAAPKEDKTNLNMKKLSDQLTSLVAENKLKDDKLEELNNKIEMQELSEDVRKEMTLKKGEVSTGFKSDDLTIKRIAEFMLSLSLEKREEFKKILTLHQTVDLSTHGKSSGTSPVALEEATELKKQNAEAARRRKEDPSKELHEHLADVTMEALEKNK